MPEETQEKSQITQEQETQGIVSEKSAPKVETAPIEKKENSKDDVQDTIKQLREELEELQRNKQKKQLDERLDSAKKYCLEKDEKFNYEDTIKKFSEVYAVNPNILNTYGDSAVGLLQFWQDYVKNDENIIESRKPQVPAKLDELSKKVIGGIPLSVDEQNEYMKMLIDNQ